MEDRAPRAVGFFDAEWLEVETAAAAAGVAAAEYVRGAALGAAAARGGPPPGIVSLFERTWLNTYLLATLKRDEMILEGRGEEFDRAARATLASVRGGRPN